VTREDGKLNKDGTTTQQFPFYMPNKNEVVMNSRPGEFKKPDFQPGATGRLPEREEACKPAPPKPGKDGTEDLFDFNMLHELAHSIDDARSYMAAKGKDPDHGGWIEIGGKVDPIVDAVIKETGFGTTAEERQYVLDSILRNPVAPLASFSGDKGRFDKFVAAAQTDNVWDSQSLTEDATLGKRVYHEGYPSTWFSYLADARKQGITSYQFRAPGEWFSELYAAWKIGKLKAGPSGRVLAEEAQRQAQGLTPRTALRPSRQPPCPFSTPSRWRARRAAPASPSSWCTASTRCAGPTCARRSSTAASRARRARPAAPSSASRRPSPTSTSTASSSSRSGPPPT
jgi:hypothetical protein